MLNSMQLQLQTKPVVPYFATNCIDSLHPACHYPPLSLPVWDASSAFSILHDAA